MLKPEEIEKVINDLENYPSGISTTMWGSTDDFKNVGDMTVCSRVPQRILEEYG